MKNFLSYTPVLWWLLSFDLAIAITAGHRFEGLEQIATSGATGMIALAAAIALMTKLGHRLGNTVRAVRNA